MNIIKRVKELFSSNKSKPVNIEGKDGQIIKENVICPACGKPVYYIDLRTVACTKSNRTWGLRDLIRTIHRVRYNPDVIFAESKN